MYQLKRVLVALDLTDLDDVLIEYISFLAGIIKAEDIYFIHVASTLELPDDLREKYPDLIAPVDENIEDGVRSKLDRLFDESNTSELHIEVKEGDPTEKVLRWAGIKEVDLIVMGSKPSSESTGTVPGKIVKVSHCSVLLLPPNTKPGISRLVVPTDFSKHSKLAFEEAIEIATATNAAIVCHNSYRVPSGYHTSGKSFEEFGEIMKGHAEKEFALFAKEYSFPAEKLSCRYTLDEHSDPASQACAITDSEGADFMVMGSKGRTALASILLGSVAEKMIICDRTVPLLVVKDKKENLGFFQALLKL